MIINFLKGIVNDYNKVIRVRDVFVIWNVNLVILVVVFGDMIKGFVVLVEINV